MNKYKALLLKTYPNTANNDVHASVSPFESHAARANWIGASIEGGAYGKVLLEDNVLNANIVEWSGDAQVFVGEDNAPVNTLLVFDTL